MASSVAVHARRVYSAEELRRLRSVTHPQNKLNEASIKAAGDDCDFDDVKEHILRPSKSLQPQTWRSRANSNRTQTESRHPTLKQPAAANDGASDDKVSLSSLTRLKHLKPWRKENNENILHDNNQQPSNSRDSPTPSIKRRKVEAIVKLHGSPTHVRVTAGGRIVPKEQSPLCHPRFGYSAIKANGGLIKFAPSRPLDKVDWTQATQNGFIAQDVRGRMCQIVNGTVMPLTEVNGVMKLYLPAPNLSITPTDAYDFRQGAAGEHRRGSWSREPTSKLVQDPSLATQSQALESQYMQIEHELKEINKVEVVHGRTMNKQAKDNLVLKRRELVIAMDTIRRSLKSLRAESSGDRLPWGLAADQRYNVPRSFPFDKTAGVANLGVSHWSAQVDQQFLPLARANAVDTPNMAFDNMSGGQPSQILAAPAWMSDGANNTTIQPQFGPRSMANPDLQSFDLPYGTDRSHERSSGGILNHGAQTSDDTRARFTHALPIMDPSRCENTKSTKSSLNPTSPAYKPMLVAPRRNEWQHSSDAGRLSSRTCSVTDYATVHQSTGVEKLANLNDSPSTTRCSNRQQSSSSTSLGTIDFFPSNTEEYSTRKHDYSAGDADRKGGNVTPQSQQQQCQDTAHTSRSTSPMLDGVFDFDQVRDTMLDHFSNTTRLSPSRKSDSNQNTALEGSSPFNSQSKETILNMSPRGSQSYASNENVKPNSRWAGQVNTHTSDQGQHTTIAINQTAIKSDDKAEIDLTKMSSAWIRGYQEGLNGRAVGPNHLGDFLDGYCSGLLKYKELQDIAAAPKQEETVQPVGPTPKQVATAQPEPPSSHDSTASSQMRQDPPTELQISIPKSSAVIAVKRAMLRPENEEALLTPAADGPHVSEITFDLGEWQRRRQPSQSDPAVTSAETTVARPTSPPQSMTSPRPTSEKELESIRFTKVRAQVPEHNVQASPKVEVQAKRRTRVFSDGAAMLRNAELAASLSSPWAASQVALPSPSPRSVEMESQVFGSMPSVSPVKSAYDRQSPDFMPTNTNVGSDYHSRFTEGTLGDTTPPSIPPRRTSLSVSPRKSPSKLKTSAAILKPGSPTRAKFEAIAEKVGIRAASSPTEAEPSSPTGKRRWRDVWRNRRNSEHRDE